MSRSHVPCWSPQATIPIVCIFDLMSTFQFLNPNCAVLCCVIIERYVNLDMIQPTREGNEDDFQGRNY
jgi:hypothetical protein